MPTPSSLAALIREALTDEVLDQVLDNCADGPMTFNYNKARDVILAALPPSASAPRGYVDGVLYCYGGCGRRYEDFGLDVLLPTPLWNAITDGPPFDQTPLPPTDKEGRGGILCAQCIVDRLKGRPGVTAAFIDVTDKRPVCDCGRPLTDCVDCAVGDYQAEHPECSTCCPSRPPSASAPDTTWRRVELGVIEFHSPRVNPGLIERFYEVTYDLKQSGSIVDLWLMDIATVLREFGYTMIITTEKPKPLPAPPPTPEQPS